MALSKLLNVDEIVSSVKSFGPVKTAALTATTLLVLNSIRKSLFRPKNVRVFLLCARAFCLFCLCFSEVVVFIICVLLECMCV